MSSNANSKTNTNPADEAGFSFLPKGFFSYDKFNIRPF